jgi:hypothetical protein
MENLLLLAKMQRIRRYYAGLVPEAEQFFNPTETEAQLAAAMATVGLRASPLRLLFTGASVVAAINSMLGGAGLALLAAQLGHVGMAGAPGRRRRRRHRVRAAPGVSATADRSTHAATLGRHRHLDTPGRWDGFPRRALHLLFPGHHFGLAGRAARGNPAWA